MSTAAIIPAAGSGERLGGAVPKAFLCLGDRSLLERSAAMVGDLVDLLVVAVAAELTETAASQLNGVAARCVVVVGGARRQDSVAAGLAALPADIDIVLVHDAARPLMPVAVGRAVLAAVQAGAAAVVPVLPVTDTLKSVDTDGRVVSTIVRSGLVAVQTPQGFQRRVLDLAHRADTGDVTDDAAMVEALGFEVRTVPGDLAGFKITTPYDVVLAEAVLAPR